MMSNVVEVGLLLLATVAAWRLFAEGEFKMPMLKWAGKAKVVNRHVLS